MMNVTELRSARGILASTVAVARKYGVRTLRDFVGAIFDAVRTHFGGRL